MSEAAQYDDEGIPAIEAALAKLIALGDVVDSNPGLCITRHDIDVVVRHVQSTIGHFTMPDVPM